MKNVSAKMSAALLISSLALLPGCDWKSKLGLEKSSSSAAANDGSAVLATINGKPLLTAKEFETQFKNFIEKHPYGAMLAQMEGVERKMFDGVVSQKLMSVWVTENGIDKTDEYKESLEQLVQFLNARFFQMKHPVTTTESEARDFYNKNKENMPEATMSRGGINASAVSFAKEADAKAFLEKAKGKALDKAAKEANLSDKFRDFKLVNPTSIGIDQALKEKVMALKKFPTLEVIKAGDTYYVVSATGKEEPKYRSFEEVKASIEQRLNQQKQEQALEKEIEKLKKDYNVVVDESYFNKKAAAAPEKVDEEQLEMVMPEAPAQEKAQAKMQPATKAA